MRNHYLFCDFAGIFVVVVVEIDAKIINSLNFVSFLWHCSSATNCFYSSLFCFIEELNDKYFDPNLAIISSSYYYYYYNINLFNQKKIKRFKYEKKWIILIKEKNMNKLQRDNLQFRLKPSIIKRLMKSKLTNEIYFK